MPVNITDSDAFTDPIVAPAGADPADQTYVVTIAQAAGNRTRTLANRLGGADGSGEWTYRNASGVAIPKARIHWATGLDCLIRGTDWTPGVPSLISAVNSGLLYCNVTSFVPESATITAVRVLLQPGAARSGGNKMLVRLDEVQRPAGGAPTTTVLINDVLDDGTTNRQFVPTGNLSAAYGPLTKATRTLELKVRAGNDAASNIDVVYGVEITFSQPGPR